MTNSGFFWLPGVKYKVGDRSGDIDLLACCDTDLVFCECKQLDATPPRTKVWDDVVAQFLETAAVFENTGSGFYGGALLNITQTPEYFPTAVGLCTVESRHASWLNSLVGEALVPNFAPVESPIPQNTVLDRKSVV